MSNESANEQKARRLNKHNHHGDGDGAANPSGAMDLTIQAA
jgi:hypothetical protein